MYFLYCTSATRRFSFTFRWSWASLLWLGLTFIRIIHIKNCGKNYVGFYALGTYMILDEIAIKVYWMIL